MKKLLTAYVVSAAVSFPLAGCFLGVKAHSSIFRHGELPYVLDHVCVAEALHSLSGTLAFTYEERTEDFQGEKFIHHAYTYLFNGDSYPKMFDVVVKYDGTTIIRHSVSTSDSYEWSSSDLSALTKNEGIGMRTVEKSVIQECKLPSASTFFNGSCISAAHCSKKEELH